MSTKKKNFWYYLGQAAIGLASIAVTFSEPILNTSFGEHTLVNQLAIPIGATLKFLWDKFLYKKDALPGRVSNKYMDIIPNAFTGIKGSTK